MPSALTAIAVPMTAMPNKCRQELYPVFSAGLCASTLYPDGNDGVGGTVGVLRGALPSWRWRDGDDG
jgi:hypothetical protein